FGERHDPLAKCLRCKVGGKQHGGILLFGQARHAPLDVGESMNGNDERLNGKRRGSSLNFTPEEQRAGIIRIVNEGNAMGGWRNLFQCFEYLAEYREFQVRKAGDVAAGPREALQCLTQRSTASGVRPSLECFRRTDASAPPAESLPTPKNFF